MPKSRATREPPPTAVNMKARWWKQKPAGLKQFMTAFSPNPPPLKNPSDSKPPKNLGGKKFLESKNPADAGLEDYFRRSISFCKSQIDRKIIKIKLNHCKFTTTFLLKRRRATFPTKAISICPPSSIGTGIKFITARIKLITATKDRNGSQPIWKASAKDLKIANGPPNSSLDAWPDAARDKPLVCKVVKSTEVFKPSFTA